MIKSILPLTNMEKVMIYSYMNEKQNQGYYEQLSFLLEGAVDVKTLIKAYEFICVKFDALRSIYRFNNIEQPVKIVLNEFKPVVQIMEIPRKLQTHKFLEKWEQENCKQYFEIEKKPPHRLAVFKMDDNSYKVYFSFHHIILDGWSLANVIKTWLDAYDCLVNRSLPSNQKISEKAYYSWISNLELSTIRKWWQEYLVGYDSKPTIFTENISNNHIYLEKKFTIPKNDVQNLVRELRISETVFFQTVWGILLQRHSDSKDILFSQIISGRSPDIENVEQFVGLFIQSTLLRVKSFSKDSIKDVLNNLHKTSQKINMNGYIPISEILQNAQISNPETMFVFENYPLDMDEISRSMPSVRITDFEMTENVTVPLSIMIIPSEHVYQLKIRYNTDCFEDYFIEQLCNQIEYVSEQFLSNPNQLVDNVALERNIPINTCNDSKQLLNVSDFSAGKRMRNVVKEFVTNTAIRGENIEISYGELFRYAQKYASFFKKLIPANAVPLIIGDKSPSTIISMVALLLMGRCYSTVDSTEADARVCDICNVLKDTVVIGSNTSKEKLNKIDVPFISFEELEKTSEDTSEDTCVFSHSNSSDLAYIIFTSGTTGVPKGVAITHANLINSVNNTKKFSFNKNTTILQSSNLGFDMAAFQIWGALLNGGCLVQCDYTHLLSSKCIGKIICESKINTLVMTPSHFQVLMLDEIKHRDLLSGLRYVMLGGEKFPEKYATQFSNALPHIHLYNGYGPAEATSITTVHEYIPEAGIIVPCVIGESIDGLTLTIRDSTGKVVPVGVVGEIHIHGRSVASGYVNTDSSSFYESEDGVWSYATGDYAIRKNEGIHYIGRRDNQIKYNGYRITLEEIEIRISNLPSVESTIVVMEEASLVAYVKISNTSMFSDIVLEIRKIIPRYMQPKKILQIQSLHLNQSGKLEREEESNHSTEFNDELNIDDEKYYEMMNLWKSVLDIDKIVADDNFFDLGGDSLKVIILLGKISKHFKHSIDSKDFFQDPTVRNTVRLINVKSLEEKVTEKVLIYHEKSERIICLFPPSMPLFGYTLIYKNLSRYIDYKIYMFTHYKTDNLLDDYVSYIVKHKLDNLILMGYSFGGTIAFEMAHRLQKYNIRIKAIVFIDSYVAHVNRFTHINRDENEYLEDIIKDYLKKRNSQEIFHYNKEVTDALIVDYKLYHQLTKNINTTLKKIDVDIYQMYTSEAVAWISDTRGEWEKLCRNYITFEAIGEHSEMLDTENLKKNVVVLKKILGRIDFNDRY